MTDDSTIGELSLYRIVSSNLPVICFTLSMRRDPAIRLPVRRPRQALIDKRNDRTRPSLQIEAHIRITISRKIQRRHLSAILVVRVHVTTPKNEPESNRLSNANQTACTSPPHTTPFSFQTSPLHFNRLFGLFVKLFMLSSRRDLAAPSTPHLVQLLCLTLMRALSTLPPVNHIVQFKSGARFILHGGFRRLEHLV